MIVTVALRFAPPVGPPGGPVLKVLVGVVVMSMIAPSGLLIVIALLRIEFRGVNDGTLALRFER